MSEEKFSEKLEELIQQALDNKTSADDGEKARRWSVIRTELEKIYAYVVQTELKES